MITGRTPDADLSRIIDVDLRPVSLPESGLAISAILAEILGVEVGDRVELDLLDGQRRTVTLPIAALVEDYFGIRGMMDLTALARLMREAPTVSGVHFAFDENERDRLYAAIKGLPTVAGLALQPASLANFRESLALLVTTMAGIYTSLAAVIAFGVVYTAPASRSRSGPRVGEPARARVYAGGDPHPPARAHAPHALGPTARVGDRIRPPGS